MGSERTERTERESISIVSANANTITIPKLSDHTACANPYPFIVTDFTVAQPYSNTITVRES